MPVTRIDKTNLPKDAAPFLSFEGSAIKTIAEVWNLYDYDLDNYLNLGSDGESHLRYGISESLDTSV